MAGDSPKKPKQKITIATAECFSKSIETATEALRTCDQMQAAVVDATRRRKLQLIHTRG